MKMFLVVIGLALSLFASDTNKINEINFDKQVISFNVVEVEKSGCCSWHGGVADCRNGRVVCADGSLSPSCTCLGGKPIVPEDKIN